MGELIWLVILGLVLITAFLPAILKERCQACGTRKLVDLNGDEVIDTVTGSEEKRFVSYYYCGVCGTVFRRERSGPLQPVESEERPLVPLS